MNVRPGKPIRFRLGMRVGIAARLHGAFGLVLILMIAVGGVAWTQMDGMGSRAEDVSGHWIPGILELNGAKEGFAEAQTYLLRFVIEPDMMVRSDYKTRMEGSAGQVDKAIRAYRARIATEAETQAFDAFRKEWDAYKKLIPGIIGAGNAGNLALANELTREAAPVAERVVASIDALVELNRLGAVEAGETTVKGARDAVIVVALLTAAAVVAGVAAAWIIGRLISVPVRKLSAQAKTMAGGDLSVEPLVLRSNDELGELARSFGLMAESFRGIVAQVTTNAQQVAATSQQLTASAEQTAAASGQIAETIQDVASGAERQLQGTTSVTDGFAAMAGGLERIRADMDLVRKLAEQANANASLGSRNVAQVERQMAAISASTETASSVVDELGRRSTEIGAIVKLIGQLATQTKMLSLNASIEASRAGEHGRGFAVVAEEVRKLAEQSGEAAESIRDITEAILGGTTEAVQAMADNAVNVRTGLTLVAEMGRSFGDIAVSVEEVGRSSAQAAAVVADTTGSAAQLLESVRGIAAISETTTEHSQSVAASSQQQTAMIQQISNASSALSKMAEELLESIGVFKL